MEKVKIDGKDRVEGVEDKYSTFAIALGKFAGREYVSAASSLLTLRAIQSSFGRVEASMALLKESNQAVLDQLKL